MNKIEKHGIPTFNTVGEKGDTYIDLDTGIEYMCHGTRGFIDIDSVDEPIQYDWRKVVSNAAGGGNAVDVMFDNDYNIIECPLTYDELKERIESRKPLMINVFVEHIYTGDDMSEITYYLYPAEEILLHYSEENEGNYIMVKCRSAYYLNFRENGEITFYSVD